jgi:hypothetical protein
MRPSPSPARPLVNLLVGQDEPPFLTARGPDKARAIETTTGPLSASTTLGAILVQSILRESSNRIIGVARPS